MSEEEKKAIENIKNNINHLEKHIQNYEKSDCKTGIYQSLIEEKQSLEILLNLIQSQQKEIEKKDKIIDEMAPQIYLDKQQREEMRKYIYESNRSKDFTSFVKQYFEKKVEGKQ